MRGTITFSTFILSAAFLHNALALPLSSPSTTIVTPRKAPAIDGDDAVAYAWAVDAEESKTKREIVDGDDAVAYAWAVDAEEKRHAVEEKRDVVDGDDAVAYAWAVDAEGKKKRNVDVVDGDDAVAYAWAVDAEGK